MRQLSKQRSIVEQQQAAEKEAEKRDVLIVEENAETGSVSEPLSSDYTVVYVYSMWDLYT